MSIQENVATFVTKLPKVILLCVVLVDFVFLGGCFFVGVLVGCMIFKEGGPEIGDRSDG